MKKRFLINLTISIIIIIAIIVIIIFQNYKIANKKYNIPILMYHGVSDNGWGDKSIFTKIENFEQQMEYLHNEGYTTLFLSEIDQAHKYEKPIIITFDDGYIDVYENAFPIMKKYNIKSNMFIITSFLDNKLYMNEKIIKELSESNLVEIGSHTVNHKDLNATSEKESIYEIENSKKKLEEIVNKKIITLAYPGCSTNDKIVNTTKKDYKYAVICGGNYYNTKNTKSYYLIPRFGIGRDTTFEYFRKVVSNEYK